jgi:serine/threonine-protein kinase
MMIATERCPLVDDVLNGVPPALSRAIDSMTEIDPKARVSDAGKLAYDLDMALRSMGPNALRQAKEELKTRVETIAGPPTTSATQSGARHLEAASEAAGRRDSWSVSLGTGSSRAMAVEPPPPPPEPSSVAAGSQSSPSGGSFPQTLVAGQTTPSNIHEGAQARKPQRSIVIASVLGLVGAAVGTAFVLKAKAPSDTPALVSTSAPAASAAPTTVEPATSQAGGAGVEAAPSATASEEAATPKVGGKPGTTGGGPLDRGKPRPDGTGAASATAVDVDPAAPGSLQVIVLPWGDVSVDGKAIGTTPLPSISLAPGPHSIVVKNAELGATRSGSVNIKPGQASSVRFDLRRTE